MIRILMTLSSFFIFFLASSDQTSSQAKFLLQFFSSPGTLFTGTDLSNSSENIVFPFETRQFTINGLAQVV